MESGIRASVKTSITLSVSCDNRILNRNDPSIFRRRRADSFELPLYGEVRRPLQKRMPALLALVRFSPGEERRGWIRCRRENENNHIFDKIR